MKRHLICLAHVALLSTSLPAFAHGEEDHRDHDKPTNGAATKQAPAAPSPGTAQSGVANAATPQRLADGSVFLPKPAQRELNLRTTLAKLAEHGRSIELNGRVVTDPNAGGRVQAAQSGRVEPGPKGLPMTGQSVSRGDIVAYVRHVEDPIERSRQQAQVAELGTKLDLAQRRVSRLEQLEGSVPAREIEAARLDVHSLKKQRNLLRESLTNREVLVAPVTGVVSTVNAVAGQVVEARDTLFEIVDPQRLLIEALAYDPSAASDVKSASANIAGHAVKLMFIGAGRSLREQALPLLFRFEPAALPPVAVGQPLKLYAVTGQAHKGVALPAGAVIRSASGDSQVWVSESAERFSPRKVRTEPLDADRILVVDGLKDGERVVINGAAALTQVR